MTTLMQSKQGEAPVCQAPDPEPRRPTRFTVPAGAVDTHAHVIGGPPEFPLVANRSYTPPAATPEAYVHMLDATGMAYGVLIQVSVHGTDNSLMLRTIRANGPRLRGIAVVPLSLPDRELLELKEAGVVGVRLNVLFGGGIGLREMESYGSLCRELGWHIQLLIDAHEMPDMSRIAALPVPVVVDHLGHMPTRYGVRNQGFQALLGIVRDGAWVKLSGAYRITGEQRGYVDTIAFAHALIEAAPDRCVWGSDWPHVALSGHMMNVGDLLDLLASWVPDEAVRRKVLVENAHRLYGFGAENRPA